MIPFIIRRMLWMVVLLFVISFMTFVIFYTLPSADPALLRAGRGPAPSCVASIRHTLGLDKPWYIQYLQYLKRLVFHFDFGYSFQNNVSVKSQIFDRLPATATLAAGAAVVWLLVGIPVGIISAIKRGTWMDRAAMGSALVAISAPGLLARPRLAVPLLEGPRQVPALRGPGRVSPDSATSSPTPAR